MNNSSNKTGKVWLAGAGPGDAGLLTVKTKELMGLVDVIVYDALVSAEIVSQIPKNCRLIFVGKRSGNHPVPQEQINKILLDEAQNGNQVLRLKGGDPFVFGRGGEELELLVEANIPFEIIPGITSASAVPAYAGIPVTHRDYTSSFHIITGHARKDGTSRIDFPSLVNMDATLVFLMGISSMEEICTGLMDAGMDPDTPAAILEKGTTSAQRKVISTVKNLYEDAQDAKVGTPAIILVGKVCRLSNTFDWAEKRILGGRQFLTTRPRSGGSKLAGQLRLLGAQVIELPSIVTETIFPNTEFENGISQLKKEKGEVWLAFTSPVGVESFFSILNRLSMDIRNIFQSKAQIKIAAIGSATAKSLGKFGINPDLVPPKYSAIDLGAKLAETAKPDSRIIIMRAYEGSEQLIPPLIKKGLKVDDIPVYKTVHETHEQIIDKIKEVIETDQIDAITFTSASTVHGFVKTLGQMEYHKIRTVCIGEQTADTARKYNMNVEISEEASMDSMITKITELYGEKTII